MNATTVITDAQRQGLEYVTSAQDRILKMNKDLANTIGSMVKDLPEMPEIPLPPMPSIDLPSIEFDASAVIDQSFELTNEWLESQRTFAKELYNIWKPVEKATEASAAATTTVKKATKTTAKKATKATKTTAKKATTATKATAKKATKAAAKK